VTAPLPAAEGWNLIWNDEFTGSTLDNTKWDAILWTTPFNNERQAYHPNRVTVSGGNLVLTADDADFGGKSYTSGKVESKWTRQYGRWEVRAKLPATQGTWPAIWLLPDTGQYPWPSQGEIDILENRGTQPHLTSSAYHYGPNFSGHQFQYREQVAASGGQLENYHDSFHTYAVEWDANRLRFFVDDVHFYTIEDSQTGGFLGNQTAPVETVLNVAVGGDFLGGAQTGGNSEWPQQMLVDYVRVYERDSSPPPVLFRNGGFEEQDGSLAGWSTFGNDVPNVQPHFEAVREGNSSLKIFGQFSQSTTYSGVEQGISVSTGDLVSASAEALVLSGDDLVGANQVFMKLDYYSQAGAAFDSPFYLTGQSKGILIGDANTANDTWMSHTLEDVAPAGAVEARLAFVFIQPGLDAGAIHIDSVSFQNLSLTPSADADGDGDVDGADFLRWQRHVGRQDTTAPAQGDFNFDGRTDEADLAQWTSQFSSTSAAVGASTAIPEPGGAALLLGLLPWLHARPR
jgi:beta-glucanase (GH16 family)